MIKKGIFFVVLAIFLLLAGSIIHRAMQPKAVYWNETFGHSNKGPLEKYILFSEFKNFFPGKTTRNLYVEDLESYLWYDTGYYNSEYTDAIAYDESFVDESLEMEGTAAHKVLIQPVIDEDIQQFNVFGFNNNYELSNVNSIALLHHLYHGNHALVAAYAIGEPLNSYLGLQSNTTYIASLEDSLKAQNLTLEGEKSVQFSRLQRYSTITQYPDSAKVILKNGKDEAIGVRVKIGSGSLTFIGCPNIFSNYQLLKEDRTIASNLLSTLPNKNTYWSRSLYTNSNAYEKQRSIMDFIHNQESLTWAFYTFLFSIIGFFLFQIKREQRAIPILKRKQNITLRFAESIANLYILKENNKELFVNKFKFFLEQIRNKYNIDTNKIDAYFFENLAQKSQLKVSLIEYIFNYYTTTSEKSFVSKDEFLRLNKLLQNFKNDGI